MSVLQVISCLSSAEQESAMRRALLSAVSGKLVNSYIDADRYLSYTLWGTQQRDVPHMKETMNECIRNTIDWLIKEQYLEYTADPHGKGIC